MLPLFVISLALVVARALGAGLGRTWTLRAPPSGVHPLALAAPGLVRAAAGAAFAVACFALLPRVPWTWLTGTCACDAWGGLHVCPVHFDRVSGLVWVVAPFGGWALVDGVIAAWRQALARRDLRRLTRDATPLACGVHAVEGLGAPVVFVAGLWRPTLYVDPVWWQSLDTRERAVIEAHERGHILAGDVVTHAWLDVALAVIAPRARAAILSDWAIATEVRADARAVAVDGDPLFVAEVLCRFARAAGRPSALAPGFGERGVRARVEALLLTASAPPGSHPGERGWAVRTWGVMAFGVALGGHLIHRAFELALHLL
jgi:hypothetical protein